MTEAERCARVLAGRWRRYAAKFVAEHDDPENGADWVEPADHELAACYQHCARPALHDEYPAIRRAIARMRTELKEALVP